MGIGGGSNISSGGGVSSDVNVINQPTVTVDDSTPLDTYLIGEDGYKAQIGPDGRLHTTKAPPQTFTGYTYVQEKLYSAIEGHNYEISEYTIPNGKTLHITNFSASGSGGNSSAGIYYVPDGVFDDETVADNLIIGTYFSSTPAIMELDKSYIGDGTAKIVLKATRRDKGKEWIGCDWQGFIED
jgi:hypothetical protein